MERPKGEFFDFNDLTISGRRVLLVEGVDDTFFLDKLLNIIGADPSVVQIIEIGGKQKLSGEFVGFMKARQFITGWVEAYAILVDADDDPETAIKSVHQVLKRFREPCPNHGEFRASSNPKDHSVGLFIIPDGAEGGDLDGLCMSTVVSDPIMSCVDGYFECVGKLQSDSLNQMSKRRVQVYLAAKRKICRGAGTGFTRGYFDEDHDCLESLKKFLRDFVS